MSKATLGGRKNTAHFVAARQYICEPCIEMLCKECNREEIDVGAAS